MKENKIIGAIITKEVPEFGRPVSGTLFEGGEHGEVQMWPVMTSDVLSIKNVSKNVYLVGTRNSMYIVKNTAIADYTVEICFSTRIPELDGRWLNKTISDNGELERTLTSPIQGMVNFHGGVAVKTLHRLYLWLNKN